jgi:AraC family transcriptional regulator
LVKTVPGRNEGVSLSLQHYEQECDIVLGDPDAHIIAVELGEKDGSSTGLITIVPERASVFIRVGPDSKVISIRVTDAALSQVVGGHGESSGQRIEPVACERQQEPIISALAASIWSASDDSSEFGQLEQQAALSAIIARVARLHATTSATVYRHKGGLSARQLRLLIDHINEHMGEPVTLEELANLAKISQSHLCQAFRQSTGSTPHQYHIARRIDRARLLLAETDLPIADIALIVGYGDQSQFGVAFRKSVGISPLAYRRNPVHVRGDAPPSAMVTRRPAIAN